MNQVFILLALAACTSAQVVLFGSPRVYKPLTNFNKEKFIGKWYFYATIPNKFEPNTICSSANVTLNSNGTVQTLVTNFNMITGYYQRWGGLAVPSGPLPSEFSYIFPSTTGQKDMEFKILDGDENLEHYVVVFVVQKLSDNRSLEYVWVSSRYPQLESEYYERALDALRYNNIDVNALQLQRQNDCPSY